MNRVIPVFWGVLRLYFESPLNGGEKRKIKRRPYREFIGEMRSSPKSILLVSEIGLGSQKDKKDQAQRGNDERGRGDIQLVGERDPEEAHR